MDLWIALGFLIIGLLSLSAFLLLKRPSGASAFRRLASLEKFKKAATQATENGRSVHLSLGSSSILSTTNASALSGLAALPAAVAPGMGSDRPAIVTSGDGTLALLSQDALAAAYQGSQAQWQVHPSMGRLAGTTRFSYLAGLLAGHRSEHIAADLLSGCYGPEIALLCDLARSDQSLLVAASESIPAQAAMFASAEELLIGEELFALPAYFQAQPAARAGLQTQDLLRWLLIAVLLGSAFLKLAETLLGAPLL